MMFRPLCVTLFVTGTLTLDLSMHSRQGAVAPSGRQLPIDLASLKLYTLNHFVQDFARTYTSDLDEWRLREKIFQDNLQKVLQLRSETLSWTPGITMFMDYSDDEYNRLLGYRGRRAQLANVASYQKVPDYRSVVHPNQLDFRSNRTLTSMVHDQGACGSCWAAATISVMEGAMENSPEVMRYVRSSKDSQALSMQAVLSCTANPRNCGGTGGCQGATTELGFEMIMKRGLPLATKWPYLARNTGNAGKCKDSHFAKGIQVGIKDYTVLPSNKLAPLFQALTENGSPIAVAVDASHWSLYTKGIYSDTANGRKGDFTVNHAVTLMGYAEKRGEKKGFWLIKNSWGRFYGESGYIRIEMKDNEEEHCGWDNNAHVGIACDGDPDKVWVCGTCGLLYDSTYVNGIYLRSH